MYTYHSQLNGPDGSPAASFEITFSEAEWADVEAAWAATISQRRERSGDPAGAVATAQIVEILATEFKALIANRVRAWRVEQALAAAPGA